MSDAPETIWATMAEQGTGSWNSEKSRMQEHMPPNWQTEYRRADLPATDEQITPDPKVLTMLRAAYLAGFSATGEGYNAEWPFQDYGKDPEQDEEWLAERDAALAEFTTTTTTKETT